MKNTQDEHDKIFKQILDLQSCCPIIRINVNNIFREHRPAPEEKLRVISSDICFVRGSLLLGCHSAHITIVHPTWQWPTSGPTFWDLADDSTVAIYKVKNNEYLV